MFRRALRIGITSVHHIATGCKYNIDVSLRLLSLAHARISCYSAGDYDA